MPQIKEYSELKKRALLAKQRMRMGYWQSLADEKTKALGEVNSFTSIMRVKELQHARIERDLNKTFGSAQTLKDEALFKRVCEILDGDEDAPNPIGQLVDHEEYDRLDPTNKQRYILELSKKFIQLRERYYKERLNKSC